MKRVKIKTQVEVEFTVELLAEAFCQMDDDGQARFFCAVAAIADGWRKNDPRSFGAWWQWSEIGKHLVRCSCSTDEGRQMIRDIFGAMEEAAADASVRPSPF